MSKSLSLLVEKSVQTGWDFLERSGEIANAAGSSRFIVDAMTEYVQKGKRGKLMLSNRDRAYRRRKRAMAGLCRTPAGPAVLQQAMHELAVSSH
jgi:hypothetical protein